MMTNPLHYPSIELCKKLTKIWFPETQMERIQNSFFKDWISMTDKARNELFDPRCFENLCSTADVKRHYVCPSVMEMWDIIPTYIWKYNRADDFYKSELRISKDDVSYYQIEECESIISFPILHNNTLPDCLAEMVIWLKNNNHLPKK